MPHLYADGAGQVAVRTPLYCAPLVRRKRATAQQIGHRSLPAMLSYRSYIRE